MLKKKTVEESKGIRKKIKAKMKKEKKRMD